MESFEEKVRIYLTGLSVELDSASESISLKLKNRLHNYSEELDCIDGCVANLLTLSSLWRDDPFMNSEEFAEYMCAVKADRALRELGLENVEFD